MRILLLAPKLLGESLALQITSNNSDLDVILRPEALVGHPKLVIWSIDAVSSLAAVRHEAFILQERWQPAPLLLLLPAELSASKDALLALPAAGLLQNCDVNTLQEVIATLLEGGRVIRLQPGAPDGGVRQPFSDQAMGLGHWLLMSGLQQISNDLQVIDALLADPPVEHLWRWMLEGRRRELRSARALLLWLWGPIQLAVDHAQPLSSDAVEAGRDETVSITLRDRQGTAVWEAIRDRLDRSVGVGLGNATGRLLAIEGLHPERRRDLLFALLQQLDLVLQQLRGQDVANALQERWDSLQEDLRRQALSTMAGTYVQLPQNGSLRPVVAQLLTRSDLSGSDQDLPDPSRMLMPLLKDQPVLVDGQLLPADDPRALLQLEILVSNWLVRTAELIGAELLDACGEWPELRRYLLCDSLLSTRELDRLRNQLNSQIRWSDWVERPIQLYESQRMLFQLQHGRIAPLLLTEPRDQELNQLGWWQRQVALLVETRDALAPQVQTLVRRLGDLLVVLLTQVIGRAIGLIGRGIAQGMGRSLGRG